MRQTFDQEKLQQVSYEDRVFLAFALYIENDCWCAARCAHITRVDREDVLPLVKRWSELHAALA